MATPVNVQYVNEKCRITRATDGSIGGDMRAKIPAPVTVQPEEMVLIPLGVKSDLGDPNLGMFLFGRSGLAKNHGIQLLNSVGVIDSDFRGEVGALLYNTGITGKAFTVEPYDRVAQCIFIRAEEVVLVEQDALSETARGEGGYNSTGVK